MNCLVLAVGLGAMATIVPVPFLYILHFRGSATKIGEIALHKKMALRDGSWF